MTMVDPGWYADPVGRHPHRYWDGARWTEHVAGPAGQGVDPIAPAPQRSQQQDTGAAQARGSIRCDPAELLAVLAEHGIQPRPAGGGTLLTEPLLLLAWSESRAEALEWWTPDGRLVAVATSIEPSDAEIEEHGTAIDEASGDMVGTRMVVADVGGTPLARTVRTLKPAKPPTYLDDPSGQRLATLRQEKIISRRPSHTIVGTRGESLGRFDGVDARGSAMVLTDAEGAQVATVVKHGAWDAANQVREMGRRAPALSVGEWLGDRVAERLWPIRRERICSVLVLDRPLGQQRPDALLTVLSPLLLEHLMGLV